MDEQNLETQRFLFEKEKFEKDIQLREREIILKEKQFKGDRGKITPPQAVLLAAVFAFLGTCLGALLQGYNNQIIEDAKFASTLKLEKKKFEYEIVSKVATSDSIPRNKKNLEFMLKAGFITDEGGKIDRLVKDSSFDLRIVSDNAPNIDDLPGSPAAKVYICRSGTAFAYHARLCQGLKQCTYKIDTVTVYHAVNFGRLKACGYCY